MHQITSPVRLPYVRRPRGRTVAIVLLAWTLLFGGAVIARDAGALTDGQLCAIAALQVAGGVGLLVVAPPVGVWQILITGGLSLAGAGQAVAACGAWVTTDLSEVVSVYGVCPAGANCVGGGGGGGGGYSW